MTAAVTAHVESDRDRGALFPVHGSIPPPPPPAPMQPPPPHLAPTPARYNMGSLLADTRFKLGLALADAGLYGTEAGRRAMCTVQVRAPRALERERAALLTRVCCACCRGRCCRGATCSRRARARGWWAWALADVRCSSCVNDNASVGITGFISRARVCSYVRALMCI